MNRDKAIKLARGYIFSQWPKLFEPEVDHTYYGLLSVHEVILDFGPELQAYLRVWPDETVELLFFGLHDELNLE